MPNGDKAMHPIDTIIELIKPGCQQMRIEHREGDSHAIFLVRNNDGEHWSNGPSMPADRIEDNVKIIAKEGYTVNRIKG
jgi:hypothetical protein